MSGVVREDGEGMYSTWHCAWYILEAQKMLVPFSPSFRYNMLTFICKNYDSTGQMSRGYGVRILSLLSVKLVRILLH